MDARRTVGEKRRSPFCQYLLSASGVETGHRVNDDHYRPTQAERCRVATEVVAEVTGQVENVPGPRALLEEIGGPCEEPSDICPWRLSRLGSLHDGDKAVTRLEEVTHEFAAPDAAGAAVRAARGADFG